MTIALAAAARSTKNAMVLKVKAFLLVVLSAAILTLSYPQLEWAPVAFIALVPLLFAIDGQKPWVAFRRSWCCGLLFFAATLGWFIYVTYPGAALLISYLALYIAFFGLAVGYFKFLPFLPRLFVLSSVWVALEFVRSHFLSGFGWVTLGHSQYKNLLFIQIADITGVYGISFLIILVNLLVFESIKAAVPSASLIEPVSSIRRAQIIVIAMIAAVLAYGFVVVTRPHAYPSVKVGVIQPNIPLSVSWEASLQPDIVKKNIRLTRSLKKESPEIIIWPETSLPGVADEVPQLVEQVHQAAGALKIPLLYGMMVNEGGNYYNSALLVSAEGKKAGRYDKMHLVPFGEYLPLRPLLGWISRFVPLEDFSAGRQYTIFEAGCPQKTFGVLICFEDTVSELRRGFAKRGAAFLVNMTNDAWFEDTKAPFLHLQASVLGAVENKRSLVRAANTGVSAFIDPYGRIIKTASNDDGKKSFVTATAVASVPLLTQLTFYTKYGDVFAFCCILVILLVICKRKFF